MNTNRFYTVTARGWAAWMVASVVPMAVVLALSCGTAYADNHEKGASAVKSEKADSDAPAKRREPPRRGGEGAPPGPPAFDEIDKDGDGAITRDEFNDFHAKPRPDRGPERPGSRELQRPGPPRGRELDSPRREPRGRASGPPRGGGPRGGDRPPHRPEFRDLDTNDDGYISMREWNAFHMNRGPRGGHGGGEFRGPRGGRGGGEFRSPRGGRGGGEFRCGRGGRGGWGPRGRGGGPGPGRFGGPPPRPEFDDIDADGNGSISKEEFRDFRATRGPGGPRRGRHDLPREESF